MGLRYFNRSFGLTSMHEDGRKSPVGEAGVESYRTLTLGHGRFPLYLEAQDEAKLVVCLRQIGIELNCFLCRLMRSFKSSRLHVVSIQT